MRGAQTQRCAFPGRDARLLIGRQRRLVSLELVIVDFASSTLTSDPGYAMIGTNAYRAPEVTLGEYV